MRPVVPLLLLCLQTTGTDESLNTQRSIGYRRGRRVELVLAHVDDGSLLELEAALFFSWMARSAREDGIVLKVRSGFRTHAKQKWLFHCYETCSCNGCRRAARPGYSSHQTGRAVDLDITDRKVRRWLGEHAAAFGFVQTVRDEPWHYEYFER